MNNAVVDREFQKFRYVDGTLTKVAVNVENDSPIPVSPTPDLPSGYESKSIYGQTLSVASGSETTILSSTIADQYLMLSSIEVSGTNKADYRVYVDSVLVARKVTYYTELSDKMIWDGYKIDNGSLVEIKVIHSRPHTGDFFARIIGVSKL